MSQPQVLGRYRILDSLGSGAMGDVFLAEDPRIERRLAIKTVRLEGADEAELSARRARLLMEAKAAGQLVHPHVVTLFDAGEDQGVVFLAFEYIEGTDLGRRLKEEPPLTLREVLTIASQTAEALAHAHENGIVHRDIKPGNILLTTEGVAKIGDFGIAKMRDRVSNLTSTGTIIGTPYYMSPEQVRGESLDGRSDIFSLGSVLYEILHRVRPFGGDTITTLVYQILHHDPVIAASGRPDLPPPVVRLLEGMLAKDLESRFASANEVVKAVESALGELPQPVLDSPAYFSLESDATIVNTPISVVPPPPPSQPGGVSTASPLAPSPAPPQPLLESVTVAPASTGPSPGSSKRSLGRWAAALGCLAVTAVLGAIGTVVVVGQLQHRFGRDDLLAERSGNRLDGPLPTPSQGTEAATTRAGAEDSGNTDPTGSDVSAQVPRVVVDEPSEGSTLRDSFGDEASTTRDIGRAAPDRHSADPPPTSSSASRPAAGGTGSSAASKSPAIAKPSSGGSTSSASSAAKTPDRSTDDIAFDSALDTTILLQFRVDPSDAYVALRAPGDERFTQIGRAEEYDPSKRRSQVFDLPGQGTFYLLFRREGFPDRVIKVSARGGGSPTVVTVNLGQGAARVARTHYEVRQGITFGGGPQRARILVDGRDVGRLRAFSDGRLLRLEPGRHEVVVAARARRLIFTVEVHPGAPARQQTILLSPE